ncbi:MAG: tetratricopeptide repeat protein, partial [Lactobacillales bacterium]|nr:tetratricopeptide repeat protein [Lactobacillales bacterium]
MKKKPNNTPTNPEDARQLIQQRILEREVDEELQKERMIHFWKKYGILIACIAILAILGAIGYEWHKSYTKKIRLSQSDIFEQAVIDIETGNTTAAMQKLDTLIQTANGGYLYLAKLKKAAVLFNTNKTQDAVVLLEEIVQDKNAPEQLQSTAAIAIAGHAMDTYNSQKLLELLQPLLNESHPFYAPATELYA